MTATKFLSLARLGGGKRGRPPRSERASRSGWLVSRLVEAVGTIAASSVLVWSLLLFTPGDPADRVLRARGIIEPEPEQLAEVRAVIGLDGGLVVRFLRWGSRVVRGDLGVSWVSGRTVARELGSRVGATAVLTFLAIMLAVFIAFFAAGLAASFPGRWPDTAVRAFATVFASVPGFLVGLCVLQFAVVGRGWGRVIGDGSIGSAWWPALTLALPLSGVWARFLRANLLSSLASPYADVARARGMGRARLLVVHGFPNALVPFLSLAGIGVSALLGGAPIAETIFTWPGIGKYAVDAVGGRDLPVIQGFALLTVAAYVLISLACDSLSARLDPRLRRNGRSRNVR